MVKKILLAGVFLAALLLPSGLFAEEPPLSFSPGDRILVVAPHPDDETLGLGGVLQRARTNKADIRVLYLTNGELNEVSSIFYQKRPLLLKSDFIKKGLIRRDEAAQAMAFLGLRPDQLVFFGYPDGGTLNIWLKYWGNSKPYRSLFTRIKKVPFKDNFSAGHDYRGDEIIRDFERILLSYQPTAVFVTAPFDLNTDHQAAYLYTQVALLNVSEQLVSAPKLYLYVIHAHQWPQPKKFAPEEALSVPTHIDWSTDVRWGRFRLEADEVAKKGEAIQKYKSQISYKKNFLLAFARKNEIYADYPAEKLAAGPDQTEPVSFGPSTRSGDVRYKIAGGELWMEVPLSNMLDEMGVLSAYVFSYRKGFLFSDMPKFAFKLFGTKMFVYDGARSFHDPDVVYRFEKGKLLIRIPLHVLKDPDFLFVSTRNAKEELSLDFGAWKVLEIVKSS